MPQLAPEEKSTVPSVDFMFREDGEFVTRSSEELFNGKKVVLFALPINFLVMKRSTTNLKKQVLMKSTVYL